MPTRIEHSRPADSQILYAVSQLADALQRRFEILLVPVNPDQALHNLLQIAVDRVRAFASLVLERREHLALRLINLRCIDRRRRLSFRVLSRSKPCALAKNQQVRERIAPQTVCAV